MDYGFVHEGRVFTPNQTTGISPDHNAARNAEIEKQELAAWAERPDRMVAYFHFPAEDLPLFGRPRPYRREFRPVLHTYINQAKAGDPGTADHAHVTTWPGTRIGVITSAKVYAHNFGSRMVAIRVRGTNGAEYYGRASWDHGQVVTLRRVK